MTPEELQIELEKKLASNITVDELHTVLLGLVCEKLGITNAHIVEGVATYINERTRLAKTLSMMEHEEGGYHA